MRLEKLFNSNDYSTTEPLYQYVAFMTNEFVVNHGCELIRYIDSGDYGFDYENITKIIHPIMNDWLAENFIGKYEVDSDWVLIEKESDAMLFKLTWC